MWKRIHKKLRARSGETLAEVLVALLIIALSSALLLVMINTAASIDLKTRARDKTFYEDLTGAETHTGTAGSGEIAITVEDDSSFLLKIPVTTYGGNGMTS